MAFRIVFIEWIDPDKLPIPSWSRPWLYPQFDVYEEAKHLFFVNLQVHKDLAASKYGDKEEDFKRALLQYSVRRIEDGLLNDSFLIDAPERVREIRIEKADLPFIEKLLEEKTCTYQVKETRDFLCSAASRGDKTVIGHVGLRSIAPTSRPLCRACTLPNTDYLCSHLLHPEVQAILTDAGVNARRLLGALCDLGNANIGEPSRCHAGGHPCWERIVESAIETPIILTSALALPEAFDYLEAVWRNAFGPNHRLLHLTTIMGMAQLAQPCKTPDEFESGLSVLSAVFKAMTIQDDLLPPEAQGLKQDHTFDRLLACQTLKNLDEADYQEVQRAVDVLRTVNKVRNVQQHSNKRELVHALIKLGVPYPVRLKNSAASIQLKPLRLSVYWTKEWCHNLRPEERP